MKIIGVTYRVDANFATKKSVGIKKEKYEWEEKTIRLVVQQSQKINTSNY